MAVRMAVWDCSSCGHRNPGPEKKCQTCGDPRSAEQGENFHSAGASAPVVTDPAKLKEAHAGPDWTCGHCGCDNKARDTACDSCGNPRDEADKARPVQVVTSTVSLSATGGGRQRVTATSRTTSRIRSSASYREEESFPSSAFPTRLVFLGGAGVMCFVFLLYFLFASSVTTDGTVSGFEWQRDLLVTKAEEKEAEGWELPDGATVLASRDRFHHNENVVVGTVTKTRKVTKQVKVGTKTVKVGEKDLGNGYLEDIEKEIPIMEDREVDESYDEDVTVERPVSQKWYTYRYIARTTRTETAKESSHNPYWPELSLAANETTEHGGETYWVKIRAADGREFKWKAKDESDWRTYEPEGKLRLSLNRVGTLLKVER